MESRDACRCCLASDDVVRSAFEPDSSFARQIWECAEVRIEPDDGLPAGLCSRCVEDLARAHDFRARCRRSDAFLRSGSARDDSSATRHPVHQIKVEVILDEDVKLEVKRESDQDEEEAEDEEEESDEDEDERPYACERCSYRAPNRSVLAAHSRKHTGERPYACADCGKTFVHNGSLSTHRKTAHSGSTWECGACGKRLSSQKSLERHEKLHDPEKPPPPPVDPSKIRTCEECGYSTRVKQCMIEHVRVHTGERPYKCGECGKTFKQQGNFAAHRRMHAGLRFACKMCEKSYTSKRGLNRHVESAHFPVSAACPVCGKRFQSRETLSKHVRRHDKTTKFCCHECGAAFSSASAMYNHRQSHHVERQMLECDYCHVKIPRKQSLEEHVLRHMKLRPYRCDRCPLACYTPTELKRHRRKHTGEKTFPCAACGLAFAHKSGLNAHVNSQHGSSAPRPSFPSGELPQYAAYNYEATGNYFVNNP